MRIVVLASGAFALPTLRFLAQSDHETPLVITQPARPSGRGRRVTPTEVRKPADELGLTVWEVENVNHPSVIHEIQSLNVRVGLVIAFGQKLRAELLNSLPAGWVNLHASLLPQYRGAAPINWAVVHGEERTGCTVFRIVERMDAGPILTSRWTDIKPEETAGELHDRLAGIGVDAVQAALDMFGGDALPEGTPQDESQVTHAPKLKKADGFVRFDNGAVAVARHVRGMTPWPGATARYQSKEGRWERVTLLRIRPAEASSKPSIPPGTIDERRYVAARDGFLEILEIKPSSSRVMTWEDYVNGRRVQPGDMIVTPS